MRSPLVLGGFHGISMSSYVMVEDFHMFLTNMKLYPSMQVLHLNTDGCERMRFRVLVLKASLFVHSCCAVCFLGGGGSLLCSSLIFFFSSILSFSSLLLSFFSILFTLLFTSFFPLLVFLGSFLPFRFLLVFSFYFFTAPFTVFRKKILFTCWEANPKTPNAFVLSGSTVGLSCPGAVVNVELDT